MIVGTLPTKRVFIGRIFGRMGLKAVTKDDKPLAHSTPTAPELFIKETSGDFAAEKANWIASIRGHKSFSNTSFVHPFFGPMTKEQIGIMDYKHIDHHLRQFGA